MAYVLLPNSGESLGFTRPQIRENFRLIQQVFDNNHYDFDAVNAGKHSVIQLPEQTVFPLTPANEGQLLAREYNSKTELAWRPESTAATDDQYILSGMPIRAAARFNGNLADGLIPTVGLSFNIDTITRTTAGTGAEFVITFLTQFPIDVPPVATANYLVIPYASRISTSPNNQGSVSISSLAVGSFQLNINPGTCDFISFIVLGG